MTDYSKLSAEELRDLLMADNLLHEFMTEEDYYALLDNESELDKPCKKVIDYCFAGLSAMPKYDDIDVRDFDIDEFIKARTDTTRKFRKTKKALLIVAAVIASMIVAQLAATAMGFDLLGYIFNWNKPEVVQIMSDNPVDGDNNENIEVQYMTIDEIPSEMKKLVPDYVFDNFEFQQANYTKWDNLVNRTFFFFDKSKSLLTIQIERFNEGFMSHIEKDDDGYFEEYIIGDNTFTIFTNMGCYQAVWVYSDYVYSINTRFEDVRELKRILDNLY